MIARGALVAIAVVACDGRRDTSAARATTPTPAPARPVPAAAPSKRPALARGGLGAITGDTIFDRAAIAAALPELAWSFHDGPNGGRMAGMLDGKLAVALGGWRFVETIDVVSPRIATELNVAIGQPYDAALRERFPWCNLDVSPLAEAEPAQLACESRDGVTIHLDGDVHGNPPSLSDQRRITSVRVRLQTGSRTTDAMAVRPNTIPRDDVVAASALRIDRDAIHPITELARVDAAALARALPRLEVTATADGFAIAHAGARVAEVSVAGGKPVRVTVFHPSVRYTLAVAIGEQRGHADAATGAVLDTAACMAASDRMTATCGLTEVPRIELAIAANVPLPAYFVLRGPFDDVRVTAITWTAPRAPSPWPTIDDDAIGALTLAIARRADVLPARFTLARDFDVVGPNMSDIGWVHAYVAGKKVLELVQEGNVTLLDPRFVITGTRVGPGSTVGDAQRAGLHPECTSYDDPMDGPDTCTTTKRRITLVLRGRGGDVAKRTIAAIVWTAAPR